RLSLLDALPISHRSSASHLFCAALEVVDNTRIFHLCAPVTPPPCSLIRPAPPSSSTPTTTSTTNPSAFGSPRHLVTNSPRTPKKPPAMPRPSQIRLKSRHTPKRHRIGINSQLQHRNFAPSW